MKHTVCSIRSLGLCWASGLWEWLVSSESKLDSSMSVRERLPAGTRVNCPIAVRTHSQNFPALWIIDGRQSVCLTTFKCFHRGSKSNQNTHEHEHEHSWPFRIFISCLLLWRHATRCYWCSLVGHKFKLAFDMYLIMLSQSNHIIIHACTHTDSLHTVKKSCKFCSKMLAAGFPVGYCIFYSIGAVI